MLQIKNVCKKYVTGELVQNALSDVSLSLRDNEFVSILGPSGSGKTTLLNVIGGLDRYDSGDLIINGISTKKYKDRDWDSYRNHTIGFVFQSYNLIPHQSILANVELALTISGITRSERRRRAKEALTKVGLGDQLHKRPNQMSGGQMQRVAIARALVNNPDILLADEPTGALDTETSVQVMELLKEVAKDRLVVMVTHNPDLAEQYSNRIVRLCDGKIIDDTNPFVPDETKLAEPEHKNMGKASMSFFTALSLSFNNLKSKKARTLLTSFAGSIGIIGIALILSISTGVNQYVIDIQKDTMTSYPITIDALAMDMTDMISVGRGGGDGEADHELDAVYSDASLIELASAASMSITENNLTEFKKYLDNPDSEIHQYLGENGISYTYDVNFDVYTHDTDGVLINTNGIEIEKKATPMSSMSGSMGAMSNLIRYSRNFYQLTPGGNGDAISSTITNDYELLAGDWCDSYDEIVLMLDENNEMPLALMYELGLLPSNDYREMMLKLVAGEAVETQTAKFDYDDLLGRTYYLVPACDRYDLNDDGTYTYIGSDAERIAKKAENAAVNLKISGIVRFCGDNEMTSVMGNVGYTSALTDYIIDYTDASPIVKAQKENPEKNILNGLSFTPANDEEKAADAKAYLSALNVSEKAALLKSYMSAMYGLAGTGATDADMSAAGGSAAMEIGEAEMAAMLDSYIEKDMMDTETLVEVYDTYISTGSYDDNIYALGVVSRDAPSSIGIYADTFEDKDNISACIDKYNSTASNENKITYTDYIGLLLSSVTTIVDVISYVLIAFVAVSLVVSSIMIGIITYISVLERTKEIGILRAIGASRHNISQVFNAETFIIGLCAGLIGIGITLLLLIPANSIIHYLSGIDSINAFLPPLSGVILVVLSIILTSIGGFIPSKKAARKDPVTALRTD